jgi:5,10-methylenetetrahydromethanopterin reductase
MRGPVPAGPVTGVLVPPHMPAGELAGFVRRAEELGFPEVWMAEDCFLHGAFTQAATVLASTASLRVGMGIILAAARNVAFAAMEIAALAELHPGRLAVGVGHGMPVGQPVDIAGRYVRLRGVQLEHAPSVVPPVFAGVRGPKSLQLSGRVAQGTILAEPVTPEYLAMAVKQVGSAGHDFVAYNVASVGDDPAAARAQVRAALAVVGEPDWRPHVAGLEFAAELAELRSRTGSAAAFADALPDRWVDRLAIVGTPERARDQLTALWNGGASRVVLIPASPEPRTALDSLARLLG